MRQQTPTRFKSERKIHTRADALIFRAKAFLLQLRRAAQNLANSDLKRFGKSDALSVRPIVAESKTALWTEKAWAEMPLMAGKIQNLRLAVRRLDGVEIPADQIFSFWKQIGRATKRKGFARGRELREGCVIPNVGGGLCQLSNALYDAALKANFEIVERHAHTQVVPGSLAEQGRDATVFWNYVDLRFRSEQAFRIEAEMDATHLIVRIRAAREKRQTPAEIKTRKQISVLNNAPNSCVTCGVGECFRSEKAAAATATAAAPAAGDDPIDFGVFAFLLDEFSPEFDEYVQRARRVKDHLFIPLDGARFGKSNYAWQTKGFAKVRQSLYQTFLRSYRSRKLAAQGAERQKSLLAAAEKLAEGYAKRLTFDATHVVVSQNLLPFLWRGGHLGGRTFDVLMNALPMTELQKRLDAAALLHPESKTLGDFRADEKLVSAEAEALRAARKIITPHTAIAALFAGKAELLEWRMPPARTASSKKRGDKFTVVFPASSVGRKGCYELRDALRDLKDIKIVTLGAIIEEADFWRGFDWENDGGGGGNEWLEAADLIALPAFVEHRPRRLLAAAAARNIPVIATKACGAENVDGIVCIEAGDAAALRAEIEKALTAARERASSENRRENTVERLGFTV
jgi:hypothetical protein